jgi:hypothetical protein
LHNNPLDRELLLTSSRRKYRGMLRALNRDENSIVEG